MDVHPDRSNGLTPRQTASATDAWLNAYSPALSPHALMRVFRHKIGQLSDQVSLYTNHQAGCAHGAAANPTSATVTSTECTALRASHMGCTVPVASVALHKSWCAPG